jgi:pilus assembly protein CpaE
MDTSFAFESQADRMGANETRSVEAHFPEQFPARPATPVALVMPDGPLRDAALYALRELNAPIGLDYENPSNWTGLTAAIKRAGVDVLLFDLACLSEADLAQAIGEIKARSPHVKVVAAYPYDDPAKILTAMRAGANEFVHSPIGPALAAAFERIRTLRLPLPAPERRGRVIGFVSAKGGCGATTAACHVAVDLKRRTGKEVLLAEFDISEGPLSFLMKAQRQYSVADALDNMPRMDANFWAALLAPSRTGVHVLPAAAQLIPGDFESERIARMIRFMRTQHDWSVIDFGRGVNCLLKAAAEELDELFVITTIDLPSLHMAKSMLVTLPGVFEKTPIRLVLNRTHKSLEVSVEEIQKIFGRPVHAVFPDDFAGLYAAYANGMLLPPDTALGACFTRLAVQLTGETKVTKTKKFLFW